MTDNKKNEVQAPESEERATVVEQKPAPAIEPEFVMDHLAPKPE